MTNSKECCKNINTKKKSCVGNKIQDFISDNIILVMKKQKKLFNRIKYSF